MPHCVAPRGRILALLAIVALVLPSPARPQNYPRLAFYGALERSGYPICDQEGFLYTDVADAMARFDEVILDVDPVTPYRPLVLAGLRARNPGVRLLGYVTGHYIWPSDDPDSLNHYPTRYWNTVRNLDGFLYNKNGQQFGLTNSAWANVNLAKRKGKKHYVVAESLAAIFYDVVLRRGGWNGVFVDTYCEGLLWAQAPAESIDFERAGYSSAAAFDTGWKAATDTLAARLRALAGATPILVGNCGAGTKYAPFNGWMRENFAYQNGGTWYANMFNDPGGYFVDEARFRTPRNNHISTSLQGGGGYPFSSDNMRRVRYGLGSVALGDGYASFVPGQRDPNVPYYDWWYDEFGVDLSTGQSSPLIQHAGWLGQPLAPYYQMIWVGTNPDAVSNPDVETDLSGWSYYGHPSTGSSLTRDTATAAKNQASIKVHLTSAGAVDWYSSLSTTTSIQVWYGGTYSATFWAKASTPRSITVVAATTTSGGYAVRTIAIGTAWQQYQVALVPLGSGQSKLAFYLGLAVGDIWLDDVHFQQGATTLYRRDFQRGVVLVNPSYSSLTVPLSRSFRRILGLHDLTTNNGALVTSVTVPPTDARFLIDPLATAAVSLPPRPGEIELAPPAPNPARRGAAAMVALRLPRDETVRLELYDASGRRVAERAPEPLAAGPHALDWDVGDLSPGLYFVRLATDSGGRGSAKWVVLR